jgi:hypothetical protein
MLSENCLCAADGFRLSVRKQTVRVAMVMNARKDEKKSWVARKSYLLSILRTKYCNNQGDFSGNVRDARQTPGSRVELEPSGTGTGFTNFQPYTTNKLSEGWLSSCCCVSCACLGWITRVAMGDKVKTAHFMVVANIDHVCTTQEVCSTKTWKAPHLRTDLASTLHLINVQLFSGEDPSVFYRDN